MTWVKICGITSIAARDAAIRGGADALGFVLAPGSPRHLEIPAARDLIRGIGIPTYVVVADREPAAVVAVAKEVGASGIQAHGRTAAAVAAAALDSGFAVLRPIPVGPDGPTDEVTNVPDDALPLFDTASTAVHGGTGRVFPWHVVAGVERPFVLAGGLGVDNVREAVAMAKPFGVDASSRLESAPGVKDPDTIISFIEEAKRS